MKTFRRSTGWNVLENNMRLKYKLALWAVAVDLLLYMFLFHSGITLPFINPSQNVYEAQFTSYPRDAGQKLVWMAFHFPALNVLDAALGRQNENRVMPLSAIQTEMIFLNTVHWLQSFYMGYSLLMIFFTLLPGVRNNFKKE